MNNRTETHDEDIEEGRRHIALERAIRCDAGCHYNEDGNRVTNHDKILDAAKKFEAYLKGEAVKETEE